jgi:hypothetical protein
MPLAVDFQGGVTSAWSNVIAFVPKLAAALLMNSARFLGQMSCQLDHAAAAA